MPISRHVLVYKLRAFLLALAVFAVFALILTLLASQVWYPDYLFALDGGLQGLVLVLVVEFVLGPLMVLVFFHPEKSRHKLVFDIVVVCVLQAAAMGWGAWQVWSQRPLAVVYGNQRFISVAPDIMRRQNESPETLARFATEAPPFIFRRAPRTPEEEGRFIAMQLRLGYHPESQAWLFAPFVANREQVFERQDALQAYVQRELGAAWQAWAATRQQQAPADYRLAFFEGRYGLALLVFSPAGAFEGHLSLGDGPLPYLPAVPVPRG